MAVLTSLQRTTLETAVKLARNISESGAYNALHALAVDHHEPFAHMSPAQRTLRNRLRSKARLLGDELNNGVQRIDNLSCELAYETWHKMLFAKFLEANNLLMHPSGVAVSMEDCEELANDEGFADKWDAASKYASRMLPAIFRPEDPLMQVAYAPDERIKLEGIIDSLDESIFTADDSLGWVYQFWQSEAKAAANADGGPIDGKKLPAVTQLFTEPYMVNFLIDNTIGAWWVNRNPGIKPPVKFEYLRLLEDGTPAAGNFEGWPDKTADITSLDPCMGSGHFIASQFSVFAQLRMYEENLSREEATDKVISENLFGLEIDPRCTQIAAFNLALTAWKFCGHYKELPEMNLACSGIAPKGKVEDWVKLVGNVEDTVDKSRMENGMRKLYEHFQLAPELGSLLEPSSIESDAFTASFKDLQPVLIKALENEVDPEQKERGVMAAGIAKAGELLGKKYTLQITNVPYLGRGRMDNVMSDYIEKNYKEAKGDLATVFFEKMLKANLTDGISCSVMPQNWLFLTSYKKYRENLLKKNSWNFVARLGSGAFSQITGEVVKAILVSITNSKPTSNHEFIGLDVSDLPNAAEKDEALKEVEINVVNQKGQLDNPDARIVIGDIDLNIKPLGNYAHSLQGTMPSDRNRLVFNFWEIPCINSDFEFMHGSGKGKDKDKDKDKDNFHYNGMNQIFKESLFKKIFKDIGGRYQGQKAWGKQGVVISIMSELPTYIYTGEIYDGNVHAIVPKKEAYITALYSYAKSEKFKEEIRKIDQKLSVTCATISKVPFDLDYWQKVADEKYPNGLPKPYSDDPTQWLFHGNPKKTDTPLQVVVARLLGYRWPAESDTEMELSYEARELIADIKKFDNLSVSDGILCIPPVNAEQAGAERLREYIQKVFANEWDSRTITDLLKKEGAKSTNLEEWLRDEFFKEHCKLFMNRPFIWHIWDGRKDGFSALVNYHKLTKANLSKLIYTYLGDWIRTCEAKKDAGESGAEGLLSAALKLKENLLAIYKGEAPYDIFVRWKTLEQQPIGWEPDLNDGVRLNIRPFVEAGVLRNKFNVKWGVDRGKNPAGSPWGEKRDNGLHLSLAEKIAARK